MKRGRGIAYLRVSSEEQKQSGAGIGSQLYECGAHAARLNVQLVASHADENVSGAAPLEDRPALKTCLAMLEPGDFLIVAKRDRLGRNPEFNTDITLFVASKGARLVSAAGEGTADDTPESILHRRLADMLAENFRLVLKWRTRSALADRKRNGRRTGQLPYGLELDPTNPLVSKSGKPSKVASSAADLEALRLIAEWDQLGWSLRSMANQLTALGFATKSPGRKGATIRKGAAAGRSRGPSTGAWSASTVRRLAARIRAERDAAAASLSFEPATFEVP